MQTFIMPVADWVGRDYVPPLTTIPIYLPVSFRYSRGSYLKIL